MYDETYFNESDSLQDMEADINTIDKSIPEKADKECSATAIIPKLEIVSNIYESIEVCNYFIITLNIVIIVCTYGECTLLFHVIWFRMLF